MENLTTVSRQERSGKCSVYETSPPVASSGAVTVTVKLSPLPTPGMGVPSEPVSSTLLISSSVPEGSWVKTISHS